LAFTAVYCNATLVQNYIEQPAVDLQPAVVVQPRVSLPCQNGRGAGGSVRGAFRSLEKLIKQIFFETDASRQQLGHAHDPSHIPSEDLLLGAEPILFVMARFATAEFVKFIGAIPYPGRLLRWKSIWHHCCCRNGGLRNDSSIWLRLFVRLGNDH
jgi:hypothetical protein